MLSACTVKLSLFGGMRACVDVPKTSFLYLCLRFAHKCNRVPQRKGTEAHPVINWNGYSPCRGLVSKIYASLRDASVVRKWEEELTSDS